MNKTLRIEIYKESLQYNLKICFKCGYNVILYYVMYQTKRRYRKKQTLCSVLKKTYFLHVILRYHSARFVRLDQETHRR